MGAYDDLVPTSSAGSYDDLVPSAPQPKADTSTPDELVDPGTGYTPGAEPDKRGLGIFARGAVGGAAGIVTAPFDVAAGATNWVRKHVFGYGDEELLKTNAGDLVQRGMTKLGLPEPQSPEERGLEMAGGLAGGLVSGAATAAERAPAAGADAGTGGPGAYWQSASKAAGTPNRAIVNNAWGQQIGEPGVTRLTSDVLERADTRIGNIFDKYRSADRLYMEDPGAVKAQIARIGDETTDDIANNPLVKKLVGRFEDGQGRVNGEQLGNLASQLGRAQKTAAKAGNYEVADGLRRVKEYTEGLISEGLTGPEKAEYETARAQYRALSQLTARVGHITPAGDVDGAALGRYLQRTDKSGYLYGRNNSVGYAAAKQAQLQDGDASLINHVQHAPGQMAAFVRAVARFAPTQAQRLLQQGIPAAGRQLVNRPGFMTILQQELDRQSQGQ